MVVVAEDRTARGDVPPVAERVVDAGQPRAMGAIRPEGAVARPGSDDVLDDSLRPITGLHHVRIPVTEPWRSREWYTTVLGFVPVLDLEREQGIVGVVLRHPTGLVVGLHADPVRAVALEGFAVLGLAVADPTQLTRWAERLDHLGVPHGPIAEGHLGPYLELTDPDGIGVRLHSGVAPYAEEA